MSINGLRFSQERHSSAPLETKSGSYIYAGDAANFHDWQFRTLLRIRLYEQQLEETSKSADPVGTTATEPAAEDADEYATFPDLSGATQATSLHQRSRLRSLQRAEILEVRQAEDRC